MFMVSFFVNVLLTATSVIAFGPFIQNTNLLMGEYGIQVFFGYVLVLLRI